MRILASADVHGSQPGDLLGCPDGFDTPERAQRHEASLLTDVLHGAAVPVFYVMGNDTMMAVDVDTQAEFRAGKPRRLFAILGMRGNFPEEAPWLQKYDVSADGQRFVFVRTVAKANP